MKLVVPNENPDLDGAASTFAYAEFLKKTDKELEENDETATGAVFGDLTEKTEEILEEIEEEISDASYYLYSADDIVLISASSTKNMTTRIAPDRVKEILDHENISSDDFPNAELIIEEDFNSAAAIVGKMFRDHEAEDEEEEELKISRQSATLLIEAIKHEEDANENDKEILEWLEEEME